MSMTSVWGLTTEAIPYLTEQVVPGSDVTVRLKPITAEPRGSIDHRLAVVETAIWYRRHGAAVAWERQILATERVTKLTNVVNPLYWTPILDVTQAGLARWMKETRNGDVRYATHPIDLGVVLPDGTEVRVEVELSAKGPGEILQAIKANMLIYGERLRQQHWHVYSTQTLGQLEIALKGRPAASKHKAATAIEPIKELRFVNGAAANGVTVSQDRQMAYQPRWPGPAVAPALSALSALTPRGAYNLLPEHTPNGLGDGKKSRVDWSTEWRTQPVRDARQRATVAAKVKDGWNDRRVRTIQQGLPYYARANAGETTADLAAEAGVTVRTMNLWLNTVRRACQEQHAAQQQAAARAAAQQGQQAA